MDWYVNESWGKMSEMFGSGLAELEPDSYPTIWGEQNTSPVAQKFGSMTSKYGRILGINKSVMAPVVIGPEFDKAKVPFRVIANVVKKPFDFLFSNAMKFLDQGMPLTGWGDFGMGVGKELYNQAASLAEVSYVLSEITSPGLYMTNYLLGGKSSLSLPRMDISGGELSGAATVEVAEVLPIARIATTVGKVGMFAKGAGRVGIAQKVPGVLSKTKGVSFWGRKGIAGGAESVVGNERFDEVFSGVSKAEARQILRSGNHDLTPEQTQKVLSSLKKGSAERVNLKISKATGDARLSTERSGRIEGYQRMSYGIDTQGSTNKVVQTAFNDLNELVRQNPGAPKNNLYDIKKWW